MTVADPRISRAAAEWIVQLGDDDPVRREAARRAFERWKSADAQHAEAAAQLERLLACTRVVREDMRGSTGPARAALEAVLPRRRSTRRGAVALLAVAVLCLPLWLLLPSASIAWMTADLRTGVAESRSLELDDGSRIELGAHSAAALHFDRSRRVLELLQGDVRVEVAHDASRPFVVRTEEGDIRALGTRFIVEKSVSGTRLAMLESSTAVSARARPDVVQVDAGWGVRIGPAGLSMPQPVDAGAIDLAWQRRQLLVQHRPLPEVLEVLGRHRHGLIRFDAARMQAVSVSAVLPLDDPDRALQLLASALPGLRVRSFTPWLVWIDMPGA